MIITDMQKAIDRQMTATIEETAKAPMTIESLIIVEVAIKTVEIMKKATTVDVNTNV